nr:TonB-dependent receptor [uncultured Halomonas sp.]
MQNKINKLALAIAAAAATAASGQAMAGAFQLNEQSVSGQGTSFAGRASTVNDASIVFGNPAGMSFLDRAQITAGATYLDVSTDINNADSDTTLGGAVSLGPVAGGNDGDMVPGTTIPFMYYVQPIDEGLTFGLGVYAPFGVITDYEDDFEGRYFGNYSEVAVVTVQPTLSIQFTEKFSAGFGITYNRIEGELESATPNPPAGPDGTVNVQGDDEAWGFTFGMMYKPVESTTLGVTYRSDVDYELEGDIEYTNVGTVPFPSLTVDAALDITLPETIDFSVTHELTDRWTVMAGAALVKWSSFDKLVIENDVREITEVQNYEDAWQYALGTSYQLNPAWVLRAGVSFDESPISDEDRTVRVPTGDRTIYSLGAGWTPIPDLTIDVAYTYLTEDSEPVSQTRSYPGTPLTTSYEADYENTAHGFGAQVTYRF